VPERPLGRGEGVVVGHDEAAVLQDAARRTDGQVTFVGVNVQDVDADAQAFMSKYGITYANGSGNAGPVNVSPAKSSTGGARTRSPAGPRSRPLP
jgi:hypothetical protein